MNFITIIRIVRKEEENKKKNKKKKTTKITSCQANKYDA